MSLYQSTLCVRYALSTSEPSAYPCAQAGLQRISTHGTQGYSSATRTPQQVRTSSSTGLGGISGTALDTSPPGMWGNSGSSSTVGASGAFSLGAFFAGAVLVFAFLAGGAGFSAAALRLPRLAAGASSSAGGAAFSGAAAATSALVSTKHTGTPGGNEHSKRVYYQTQYKESTHSRLVSWMGRDGGCEASV